MLATQVRKMVIVAYCVLLVLADQRDTIVLCVHLAMRVTMQ